MTKPLGNKPGEPPFQLKIDPDTKLLFKYKLNEPCTIELKITNTTKDRQTFKVKRFQANSLVAELAASNF
ncbi:unnamed protein product [Heligmosomoides polygyrus]|uniref:MSP domain-containing protein n=1 Tax=Heligmosomoides polygyrus TaxID=6339 RepID=A0A183FET4_HELPZ|nr:unnamed protein product [Heligmosomoides polygyrus]